jgi:hypothetical protein
MPIKDGKYKNPNWVNGGPPAIDADELNAISNTLERLDAMEWHDTSDATATAEQILAPYTAYTAEGKVTGTIQTVSRAVPSISVNETGLITATSNQDDGYVEGGLESATEQIPTRGAQTITPGTTAQTIQPNVYLTGAQTIQGDENLVPGNIKENVSIFGVTGTYEGALLPSLSSPGDAPDLLSGKQLIDESGDIVNGSMANQGAISRNLDAGASYTIPSGYHNGSGTVTANSLASQTAGTATASDIASGETAWVNGVKITGTATGTSIQSATVKVLDLAGTNLDVAFTRNYTNSLEAYVETNIRAQGTGYTCYPAVGSILILTIQTSGLPIPSISGSTTLVDVTSQMVVSTATSVVRIYRVVAPYNATITVTR